MTKSKIRWVVEYMKMNIGRRITQDTMEAVYGHHHSQEANLSRSLKVLTKKGILEYKEGAYTYKGENITWKQRS
jgi:hypothetical protein